MIYFVTCLLFWQRHSSDLFCHSMCMYIHIIEKRKTYKQLCLSCDVFGFKPVTRTKQFLLFYSSFITNIDDTAIKAP